MASSRQSSKWKQIYGEVNAAHIQKQHERMEASFTDPWDNLKFDVLPSSSQSVILAYGRLLKKAINENDTNEIALMLVDLKELVAKHGKKIIDCFWLIDSQIDNALIKKNVIEAGKKAFSILIKQEIMLTDSVKCGDADNLRDYIENNEFKDCGDHVKTLLPSYVDNASRMVNVAIPALLIQWGVDVNTKDENGRTALYYSIYHRHENIFEYLLFCGADDSIQLKFSSDERSVKFNRSIKSLTSDHKQLCYAARHGYNGTFHALMQKGVDTSIVTSNGKTLLHIAAERNLDVMIYLLKKNAKDVNKQDNDGNTPLHDACLHNNRDIQKLLLMNGADETIRNHLKKIPKDMHYLGGESSKKSFTYSDAFELSEMLSKKFLTSLGLLWRTTVIADCINPTIEFHQGVNLLDILKLVDVFIKNNINCKVKTSYAGCSCIEFSINHHALKKVLLVEKSSQIQSTFLLPRNSKKHDTEAKITEIDSSFFSSVQNLKSSNSNLISLKSVQEKLIPLKIPGLINIKTDHLGYVDLIFQDDSSLQKQLALWKNIKGIDKPIYLDNCIEISHKCTNEILDELALRFQTSNNDKAYRS